LGKVLTLVAVVAEGLEVDAPVDEGQHDASETKRQKQRRNPSLAIWRRSVLFELRKGTAMQFQNTCSRLGACGRSGGLVKWRR
jgi:hypothetical protein